VPSNAVPASPARSIVRSTAPLSGSNATRRGPVAAQTRRPSWVTPATCSTPSNGPYSRTISAGRVGAVVARVLSRWRVMSGSVGGALRCGAVEANLRQRQRRGE
jgi:hypothetical protein